MLNKLIACYVASLTAGTLICAAVEMPTGLGATAGSGFVSLDWDDNDESTLDGYNIYRSTNSGSLASSIKAVSSSDYVDNAVSNGITYYYAVAAFLTNGAESAQSAEIAATPMEAAATPPAAPSGLDVIAGNGSVSLDWDNNEEGDLAGYSVYRSTASNSYGLALATNLISSDYVDNAVSNGTIYYYVVTATDAGGNESEKSIEASVELPTELKGYDLWASGYDIGMATNDFDSDGMNNLYEYAFDGNPTNGLAPTNLPLFSKSGNGFLYVHPQRSDDTSLIYTVETTTNLMDSGSWTNDGYTVTGTNVTGGTLDFVTNDVDAVADEKFIRLRIGQ